jgi:hypothetical protein
MDNEKFQKAKTFVDGIIAKKEPWTDPEFPPKFMSIANHQDKPELIQNFRKMDIEWKRANDHRPGAQVFVDGIQQTDIKQGALGNCYFLASVAAMAEFPRLVAARFYTRRANKAGIYLLSFFVNGIETPVIVDEWMPL